MRQRTCVGNRFQLGESLSRRSVRVGRVLLAACVAGKCCSEGGIRADACFAAIPAPFCLAYGQAERG